MIVSALALAALIALGLAVAGGFVLRFVGRLTILLGLLGATVEGDLLGLLIAVAGGVMVALGSAKPLDRRRGQA